MSRGIDANRPTGNHREPSFGQLSGQRPGRSHGVPGCRAGSDQGDTTRAHRQTARHEQSIRRIRDSIERNRITPVAPTDLANRALVCSLLAAHRGSAFSQRTRCRQVIPI
jgi:hypothetical protein